MFLLPAFDPFLFSWFDYGLACAPTPATIYDNSYWIFPNESHTDFNNFTQTAINWFNQSLTGSETFYC